jgi:catechol 2,3-dioxygenase-like lactoylglutathione lyase family enzyme
VQGGAPLWVQDQRVSLLPAAIGAVTLFVEDLPRARSFYLDVFGGPVIYQDDVSAVVSFGTTMINLLDAREAPGLVAPAAVAAAGSGSRLLFSIWVDDVDALCAGLAAQGVSPVNGPVDRPWGKRTASFADPDGNLWELAQDIPPA